MLLLFFVGVVLSEKTNLSIIQQTLQYVERVAASNCIYGSWIGFEPGVQRGYDAFAPYTYQLGGLIRQKNVASLYDYRAPDNEWYMLSRNRSWGHLLLRELTSNEDNQSVRVPVIAFSDGTWTRPYYDCGSGNIWMVSYTVPFFTVTNAKAVFIGPTGIDIDLSQIDINQCERDSENDTAVLCLFFGSHHCHSSTECHFTAGKGFHRGAYRCRCRAGFYSSGDRYLDGFDGNEIEKYWESHEDAADVDADESPFQCLPCAEGCSVCVDSSPCMYHPILAIRGTILGFSVLLELLVVGLCVVVHRCREKPPFRSGSPLFLIIMCIGGGVTQAKMFVLFLPASPGQCTALAWLDIIGFSAIFGSLLLKTWRVAALCTVASSRLVTIKDQILLKRLVLVFLCATVYLSTWTLTSPEQTQLRHTRAGLKFLTCSASWWLLTAHVVETGFLLWGAYICFRVRKAPSAFNESRYITWSIYNATLTGNFLFYSSYFLAWQEGPDTIFVIEFLRTLVEAVITVLTIILPKICAVSRAAHASNGAANQAGHHRVLSHFQRMGSSQRKTVATQTESRLPRRNDRDDLCGSEPKSDAPAPCTPPSV